MTGTFRRTVFHKADYTTVGHAEQTAQALFKTILTIYQMLSINLPRGGRS
jgi:hypothetical protein